MVEGVMPDLELASFGESSGTERTTKESTKHVQTPIKEVARDLIFVS